MKTSDKVQSLCNALKALAAAQPSGQLTRCQQLAAEISAEVVPMQAAEQELNAALDLLGEAEKAVIEAIASDDGLDGVDGENLLKKIEPVLIRNLRTSLNAEAGKQPDL